LHSKTQATDPNIHDRMSPTVTLNTDIIWLVLQHAAYTGSVWDYRTLRSCCLVSREWYPIAMTTLFRYISLKNRRQLWALQRTLGKHPQTGPDAPPMGLEYDVPLPVDTWNAHTRILDCHWSEAFHFSDICQALALFPSLYEVRVRVYYNEYLRTLQDDSSLTIPPTIRALRYTSNISLVAMDILCASHIISILSKHSRLHCLEFKGVSMAPHLRSPGFFQPINALLYLELEVRDLRVTLSGDLFPNLLYLVLHQKSGYYHELQLGVFSRVKSFTVLYYEHIRSSGPVSLLPRLSETFPGLTELRLGIRLHGVQFPAIATLLPEIPSGLISLSLFISGISFTPPDPAKTQRRDSFTIPTTLKYFEYRYAWSPWTQDLQDPPAISPFLDSCKSMGIQLLPSPIPGITAIVSIPMVSYNHSCSFIHRLRK